MDRPTLLKNLKTYAPRISTLLDKLDNGDATLAEKNTIRQYLDKPYTTLDPESTYRKQIAKATADNLRGEVKSWAPNTIPYFDEMSKNYKIQDALEPVADKLGKSKGIGLYDLTAFLTGHTFGGIPGGIASVAAERALRNPNADLIAAKTISKTSGLLGKVFMASKAPLIRGLVNSSQ